MVELPFPPADVGRGFQGSTLLDKLGKGEEDAVQPAHAKAEPAMGAALLVHINWVAGSGGDGSHTHTHKKTDRQLMLRTVKKNCGLRSWGSEKTLSQEPGVTCIRL